MKDPTRSEILDSLRKLPFTIDEFDREEGIYWFASDWHGGQWSNLYSVLSTSPFRPGRMANGPDPDGGSGEVYEFLVSEFGEE